VKIERRTFKAEVRANKDAAAGRKIRGTGIVFNQLSENLGGYREQIAPDALEGCDMSDVRCLMNHDENRVLGRTVSNTLSLAKDANGLQFECEPPDTSYARDLAACMDRGDIDQCSFSFTVAPGGADWDEDDETGAAIRTVRKISRLYDVSVVTYPAYPQTSSELRSNADILSERQTAGHPAPTASNSGGVDDPLRRHKLELAFYENQ
jgi:HK97 family phage prohead protease